MPVAGGNRPGSPPSQGKGLARCAPRPHIRGTVMSGEKRKPCPTCGAPMAACLDCGVRVGRYQRRCGPCQRVQHLATIKAWDHKHRHLPCRRCGALRWRNLKRQYTQPEFLCNKCQRDDRRAAWPRVSCWLCGSEFEMAPGNARRGKRHACANCQGLYTRVTQAVGLSRERVRQLVQRECSRNGGTPAAALTRIVEERSQLFMAAHEMPSTGRPLNEHRR